VSKPRIEVYHAADGSWRYRVLAANGETMAASEGYTRRADAQRGALSGLVPGADLLSGGEEIAVHNGTGRPEYLTTDPPPEPAHAHAHA